MLPLRETFPITPLIVFSAPCLPWRLERTEYFAPPVVEQIVTGSLPDHEFITRGMLLLTALAGTMFTVPTI